RIFFFNDSSWIVFYTPASSCMSVHPALSGPAAFAVDVPPIRWWAGSRTLKCVCPRVFRHPAICLEAGHLVSISNQETTERKNQPIGVRIDHQRRNSVS
ncbi:hypothetical protein RQ831_22075, partial [Roseomonas gilardii]